MKTLALLCIFVLFFTPGLAAAENFVVSGVSPTSLNTGTVTVSTYPYNIAFPVSSAKWVWKQNFNTSPIG
jgi:hypothetical protein